MKRCPPELKHAVRYLTAMKRYQPELQHTVRYLTIHEALPTRTQTQCQISDSHATLIAYSP